MTTGQPSNGLLLTLGGSLVGSGVVLVPLLGSFALLFIATIAIGVGLWLMLFAAMCWLTSPTITVDVAGVPVERLATNVSDDWRQRAKRAVIVSTFAAVTSPLLFVVGLDWAFSQLSFGPGELNARASNTGQEILSAIMVIAGIFIGLIGLLSYFVGTVFGRHVWTTSGTRSWFIAALFLPVLPILIFAILWSNL